MPDSEQYTCPCCGYMTLHEPPGSYDICHVCFWEDDPVQLLDPWYAGGANRLSLEQSQQNVAEAGACDENGLAHARGVQADDRKDPNWRVVNQDDRRKIRRPRDIREGQYQDLRNWYYWLQ